jgi:hypothetical protein
MLALPSAMSTTDPNFSSTGRMSAPKRSNPGKKHDGAEQVDDGEYQCSAELAPVQSVRRKHKGADHRDLKEHVEVERVTSENRPLKPVARNRTRPGRARPAAPPPSTSYVRETSRTAVETAAKTTPSASARMTMPILPCHPPANVSMVAPPST